MGVSSSKRKEKKMLDFKNRNRGHEKKEIC
jgi:hypothetical protein